jgi:hypothetical protein
VTTIAHKPLVKAYFPVTHLSPTVALTKKVIKKGPISEETIQDMFFTPCPQSCLHPVKVFPRVKA